METIDPAGVETATIDELIDLDGLRVLEIGSGDGRLTFRYAAKAAEVLAIEPDADEVSEALERTPSALAPRIRFEAADAVEIDLPRHRFDLALYSWSL